MHPCPIGRGLSLYSNLFTIEKTRSSYFQRKDLGTLRLVPSSLPREEFSWETIELIGYGTVSPTVEKAFPRVEKNSFLLLEIKEKVEEVHGDQGHPLEQGNHSPGALDFVLRVLHSASTIFGPINKSSTCNIWVFVASFLVQKLHNSRGSLLLLVSSSGLEVWPFSRPLLMLKAPTTFLAPAEGQGSRK